MSNDDNKRRHLVMALDPGVTTGWAIAEIKNYTTENIELLNWGEFRNPTPKEDPEWYTHLVRGTGSVITSIQESIQPGESLLVLVENFPHLGVLRPEVIVQISFATSFLCMLQTILNHKSIAIKFVQPSARAQTEVQFPNDLSGATHAKDAWRHITGWVRK